MLFYRREKRSRAFCAETCQEGGRWKGNLFLLLVQVLRKSDQSPNRLLQRSLIAILLSVTKKPRSHSMTGAFEFFKTAG